MFGAMGGNNKGQSLIMLGFGISLVVLGIMTLLLGFYAIFTL